MMWFGRSLRKALKLSNVRELSNVTSSLTKTHRLLYCRTYPTILVQPDGSTIQINYHEPRKIIQLPLDMNTLTEEQKKLRLENRKPKIVVKKVEEIKDSFNAQKYLSYMKKSKK